MMHALWTDKYRPKTTKEMVGTNAAAALAAWLKAWGGLAKRAALISGPPGIGKTTMAHLVAKEQGFDVIEMNASDVRTKTAFAAQLGPTTGTRGLQKKRVIIMDEVDGCDRGGVPELVAIVKATKIPIICICNNRYDSKLRTLSTHCLDIRVPRPTKGVIVEHLMKIAEAEGLELDAADALSMVEESGNDIRQVINCLQLGLIDSKDREQSPFEACANIIGQRKGTLDERYESFFADSSLVPLLVQQNYVSPTWLARDQIKALADVSAAADAISDMDLQYDHHIQAMCAIRAGNKSRVSAFPVFPAWLGKNSTENKRRRQLNEMRRASFCGQGQSGQHPKGASLAQSEHDVCFWRKILLAQMTTASLVQSGQQNASLAQVVDTLDAYGLSRDDFMETMREMQVGHNDDAIKALPIGHEDRVLLDAYAAIESKTKAALTRLYNKRHKTKTKTKAKKTKEEAEEDEDDDEKSDAGI